MMFSKAFARYLHLNSSCWASEKSLLASLRKKTGYTFTNCKKALEMHSNDLVKAESWLHQQAQALGWSKATKLEGRNTSQGLVAVAVNKTDAAIVEVNCETDFVARNKAFQEMAEAAAKACLKYAEKQPHLRGPLTKIGLDSDQLSHLPTTSGKLLSDELALMIGSLGENASLRRALCLKVDTNVHLSAYAHPSGTERDNVFLGKFGGLVAIRQKEPKDVDIQALGRNLCQHVVGMDPKKVGTSFDKPNANPDDETCLIHQEYINDNNATVQEVLEQHGIEVIDFKRFECGEDLCKGFSEQPLAAVETCQ
ncbi:hypothetical protein RN001_007947 [Aquatica leii]|uniref:Elongation factor Ts, mitochondrial n=1 Tax=Aquatica leii TaxID=1421715 RepID=A0AAN7PEG9_9COLE|nr:hypothetical protein RN001_007947 [Aquatica leii]